MISTNTNLTTKLNTTQTPPNHQHQHQHQLSQPIVLVGQFLWSVQYKPCGCMLQAAYQIYWGDLLWLLIFVVMQIHPDAPANPLQGDLTFLLDYERKVPRDYQRSNKLKSIHIAEHNEKILKQSLIETQNICLPTLNGLRNERNLNQLVERVYQGLRTHIDALNVCIMRSRTAAEGDYCFDAYKRDFEAKFKPTLKNILLDY